MDLYMIERLAMSELTSRIKREAVINVRTLPEDRHWTDAAYDTCVEESIAELYERSEWGWCIAEVRVSWQGLDSTQYLGECSYESEEAFRGGGYFEDMVIEAIEEIVTQVETILRSIEK